MKLNTCALVIFLGISILSCTSDVIPKPVGNFRIDIPKHNYYNLNQKELPYSFDYADYAQINSFKDNNPYWLDIFYPKFKAKIYISYIKMDTSLSKYINESHDLAFKHASMAADIESEAVIDNSRKLYGLIYYIKGNNVASPINFYLTDSVNNFLRGALYFNMAPKNDSLSPVIQDIEKDIKVLIKTFKWKK
ncbi:MAG: gliding motility lipoprotein GldD [Bacteroidetes bacterium CG2_30_33_31]|nr:MAG: gliding motility lipoprotein GldD [Bacteroidetes bacterium CG2_30_33_31]